MLESQINALPVQDGGHAVCDWEQPGFRTEAGQYLSRIRIRYETWGRLNERADNAIVVCHALTGDAHAGDGDGREGWWAGLIGSGRAIDTDRWFVVASNVLGGCDGSSGPASLAEDGQPHALRFPVVTVRDLVRAQIVWTRAIGIRRVEAVIGGSMGGMQAWEWGVMAGDFVKRVIPIAAHAVFPPLAMGYNAVMRQSIVNDPDWNNGNYYQTGRRPWRGLSTARAIGMLTYRSGDLFRERFGRQPAQVHTDGSPSTAADAWTSPPVVLAESLYSVESYLSHQGRKLNERFDANSYLYLSRAMDSHDIGRNRGGIDVAFRQIGAKVAVIGIDSDYLYALSDLSREVEEAQQNGVDARFLLLHSRFGHDAFLAEQEALGQCVRAALDD